MFGYPPHPQFGSIPSGRYTEFMQKAMAKVDEIFDMLRDSGPKPPSVTTNDPAAAGAAATTLQIDTERRPATPVVDQAVMDQLKAKWVEIKQMTEQAFKDETFPTSDKDRLFIQLYAILDQFRARGINLD